MEILNRKSIWTVWA